MNAQSPGTSSPAGASALAAVLIITLAAWVGARSPEPLDASAPPSQFSAARAMQYLELTSPDEPTPIGSPGSDRVATQLAEELIGLGLRVQVTEDVAARTFGPNTVAGRVQNIIATLPGTDPTGTVIIAAHYDSVFGGPGAADDKAAVASALETVRAVVETGPLRNHLVVLLTDGEEAGLLGATAHVDREGPRGVVLNFEAIGNGAPSMLFETTPGNAGLLRAYTEAAPHPAGDSMLAAMYGAMDQFNTDLTVFADAGYLGLNFGLTDGTSYYHHPLDNAASLDQRGLQHHGTTMLGLTRHLGDADLTRLRQQGDAAYFTLLGRAVVLPAAATIGLAALALLTVVLLASARRRETTPARLVIGLLAALVPPITAAALASGMWAAMVAIRPDYGTLFMGEPFRAGPYRAALVVMTIGLVLGWHLLVRRRLGTVAVNLGHATLLAILGAVLAVALPGAAHPFALAALGAAVGGLVASRLESSGAQAIARAVGALPGLLVLGVLAGHLFGLTGMSLGAIPVFLLALAVAPVLPLVDMLLPPDRSPRVDVVGLPLLALTLTVGLVGGGLLTDRPDEQHPATSHLMYVQDGDSAAWYSTDARPHQWTAGYTPDQVDERPLLPYRAGVRWVGDAAHAGLPAPELAVRETRQTPDGVRVVVELRSQRDADVLVLHTIGPALEVVARANGRASRPVRPTGDLPNEIRFYDPPADGVVLELLLPREQAMTVSDYTVGLADVPGMTTRPADLVRTPAHDGDLVVVVGR